MKVKVPLFEDLISSLVRLRLTSSFSRLGSCLRTFSDSRDLFADVGVFRLELVRADFSSIFGVEGRESSSRITTTGEIGRFTADFSCSLFILSITSETFVMGDGDN